MQSFQEDQKFSAHIFPFAVSLSEKVGRIKSCIVKVLLQIDMRNIMFVTSLLMLKLFFKVNFKYVQGELFLVLAVYCQQKRFLEVCSLQKNSNIQVQV